MSNSRFSGSIASTWSRSHFLEPMYRNVILPLKEIISSPDTTPTSVIFCYHTFCSSTASVIFCYHTFCSSTASVIIPSSVACASNCPTKIRRIFCPKNPPKFCPKILPKFCQKNPPKFCPKKIRRNSVQKFCPNSAQKIRPNSDQKNPPKFRPKNLGHKIMQPQTSRPCYRPMRGEGSRPH